MLTLQFKVWALEELYVIESSLLCSPMMRLFNVKYSKNWNIVKKNVLIKNIFCYDIFLDVIYFCDVRAETFSIINPVFSVTGSFRNHSNMLVCCSRNISYFNHFKCWKQLCCLIFVWKLIFQDSLMKINLWKYKIEIFCNSIKCPSCYHFFKFPFL